MVASCQTALQRIWEHRLDPTGVNGHHEMIRVALFDGKPGVKVVEFDAVPLEREADFRCDPEGLLAFHLTQEIAKELQRGCVDGWVAGYHWHRLAGGGTRNTQPA